MTVKRSVLNALHSFAFSKSGLPYGYGGAFSRTNPRASTDCSGVTGAAGMFIASGGNDTVLYQRHGSTESWRLSNGTYAGMTRVSNASQIPRDAFFRAGFQHGGGGVYSHTACTIEYANWESRGTPGVLYGSRARAWNDSLFHEFWYIAGPVVNDLPDHVFPLPAGFYYGDHSGPENSISGKAGEPADWTNGLKRWQTAAGIVADGQYGAATAQKAREVQRAAGFSLIDGKIGPKTWPLVVKDTKPVEDILSALTPDQQRRILFELTYEFETRVDTSGYKDTLVGYVLQIDKASYLNRVDIEAVRAEQTRQGRVLDALAKAQGVKVDEPAR